MSTSDERVNAVMDGLRRYWPPFAAQALRGKLSQHDSDYVVVFVEWRLFYCHASVHVETRQYSDAYCLHVNKLHTDRGYEPHFKSLDKRWESYLESTASELYAAIKKMRIPVAPRCAGFNKWVSPASRWDHARLPHRSTRGFRRKGKPVEAAR